MASNLRRTDDLHRIKVREIWLQDVSGTYPNDGTILYARSNGLVKTDAGIYVPTPGYLAVPGTAYITHVVAVDVSATTVNAVYVNAVDVSATTVNAVYVNAVDVSANTVNAVDVSATTVSAVYVNAMDVSATTVNAVYVNAVDVSATTINTIEINVTDISATTINTIYMNAVDVSATSVNAVYVNAVDVSATAITTNSITLLGECPSISSALEYTCSWIKQASSFNTPDEDVTNSIPNYYYSIAYSSNIRCVACDLSRNTVIAYTTMGTIPTQTSSGLFDIVVAKFDPSGTLLWITQNTTVNHSTADVCPSIALDAAGDIYVAFTITDSNTVQYFKLNGATGALTWNKNVGDLSIFSNICISGNVVWIVSHRGYNPTPGPDIFKIDASTGNQITPINLGYNVGYESASALSSNYLFVLTSTYGGGGGNIPIDNIYINRIDVSSNAIYPGADSSFKPLSWGNQGKPILALTVGPDGHPVISYMTTSHTPLTTYSGSGIDIVIAKLDASDLSVLWIKQFSTGWGYTQSLQESNSPAGSSLVTDYLGNIYALYTTLSTDTFIDMKITILTSDGTIRSTFVPPLANTPQADYVPNIAMIPGTRDFVIAYRTDGTVPGGVQSGSGDLAVARYTHVRGSITLQRYGDYVGVGTCDPQYTLDVSGTTHTDSLISTDISASLINVDLVVANTIQVLNAIENVEVTQTSKTIKMWAGEAAVGRVNTAVPVAAGFSLDVSGNEKISGYMNVKSIRVNNTGVPEHTVDVSGGIAASDYLYVDSSIPGWGTTIDNGNILTRNDLTVLNNANIRGSTSINKATAPAYPLDVSGAAVVSGSMAINKTTAPNAPLDVNGTARIAGATSINKSTAPGFPLDVSGTAVVSGPVAINKTTAPEHSLDVSGGIVASNYLYVDSSIPNWGTTIAQGNIFTRNNLTVQDTANIRGFTSINKASAAQYPLDVSGTAKVDSLIIPLTPANGIDQLVSMNTVLKTLNYQPIRAETPVKYVACGMGGSTLQWSTDALHWYPAVSGAFTKKGYRAAYGNGKWVAVGEDISGTVLSSIKYSTDGRIWSNITAGGFNGYVGYTVAWNGSMWVAAGSSLSATPLNTIQWSLDGVTWSNISSGGFDSSSPFSGGYGLTWVPGSPGRWLVTGFDQTITDTIQYSFDGKQWISDTSGGFVPGGQGIASNGSLHVAVGGNFEFIQYSNDFVTWYVVPNAPKVPADIAYNGSGRWVAVGGDASGNTTRTIYYSDSPTTTWTPSSSGGFANSSIGQGARTVIWDGTKWLAGGVPTGAGSVSSIQYSYDGYNWKNVTYGGFTLATEGIAYGNVTDPVKFTVTGSLTVNGNLSATGTKAFRIQHPILPNTILYHAAIEGPRADLVYRGRATLSGGRATVQIDTESTAKGNGMAIGTFEALAANPQVFVSNNDTWDRVRGSVVGGTLIIESESATATATVDWMVVAERKDAGIKTSGITDADGFLVPEHPGDYP